MVRTPKGENIYIREVDPKASRARSEVKLKENITTEKPQRPGVSAVCKIAPLRPWIRYLKVKFELIFESLARK